MPEGRTGRPRKAWLTDKDVPNLADIQAAATNPVSPLTSHAPPALSIHSLSSTSIPQAFSTPPAPSSLASPVQLRTLFNELPRPGPTRSYLTRTEHLDIVLESISDNFTSFGDFMECLCLEPSRDEPDTRSSTHRSVLSHWLSGETKFRPVHFVRAVYRNRYSVPASGTKYRDELEHAFDGECAAEELHYARIGLSAWAAALVEKRCASEIGKLSQASGEDGVKVHMQASVNKRRAGTKDTVAAGDLLSFRMSNSAELLRSCAPLCWQLTQAMSATRKNGVIAVRQRRPHSFVQTAALSMFALSRNRSANGLMAMPIGVWLFATKAHVDVKRMLSKMALAVHDTTARNALNSISRQSLSDLRANVAQALAGDEPNPYCRKVLDNIQQHQPVHEHKLGAVSQLITGTAATAVILDDFAPGAFDLGRLQDKVFENERRHLTVNGLLRDLNTAHLEEVTALHFVRVLCKHSPTFAAYSTILSDRFRTVPIAKHRMCEGRRTPVVPLGSNSHYEMATDGMRDAQLDFDKQSGHTEDAVEKANVILLYGGDGGSVMSSARVAQELRHLACTQGPFSTRACVLMTPGVWHVRYTMMNTLAANFFGPTVSQDPSSISRAAWATNLHRPTNLSKCDFFSTVQTFQVVFEARVQDIWSRELAGDIDLETYYTTHQVPTFDKLLSIARQISSKYASSRGLRRVQSAEAAANAPPDLSFPIGDAKHAAVVQAPTGPRARDAAESDEKDHVKAPGYSGDRVLSNAILFLREWSMWEECSYAVLEGDIGRVWEIFKYWIFVFAGGGNHTYRSIILELYCLFRYEASQELKEGIWNNWLVNLTGELGKWMEDDLMQEHYNRWLEDMISKHGGKFEDPLFRETISPNVEFFVNLKKEMELGLGLDMRSQSHTSSEYSAEHKILRKIYRDDQVHYFVAGRSKGHAAKDLFELGYQVLMNGKLQEFLDQTSAEARLLADLQHRLTTAPLPVEPDKLYATGITSNELEPDTLAEASQLRLAALDNITERLASGLLAGDRAGSEINDAADEGDEDEETAFEIDPDIDTERWLEEDNDRHRGTDGK